MKKIFLLQLTILAALKLTRAKAQNIFFCCERVREWNTDNLISWTAPHCPGHALNKLSSFVYSSSYMLYAARRPKIRSSHVCLFVTMRPAGTRCICELYWHNVTSFNNNSFHTIHAPARFGPESTEGSHSHASP
jgi:hypothetical protein